MTRIAISLAGYGISGGTNVILQHAQGLVTRGFCVTLVSRLRPELSEFNWHPCRENIRSGSIRIAAYGEIARESFDIAIATYWETVFDVWRITANRYVYFVQSDEVQFADAADLRTRQLIAGTYELGFGVVTVARWLGEYLKAVYGVDAQIVLNGIDKKVFSPDGPRVVPRKAGVMRILVEGDAVSPRKNVRNTVSVCKEAGVDEVWLLTSSRIEHFAGADLVFSAIAIDRVPCIYRACDVIVKLSLLEGMFGPPLEMFHCGGACVVFDVPGHEEYIIHGYNGLVAKMHDYHTVRRYLTELIEFPQLLAELKANALATAEKWIDRECSTDRFADALLKAANEARCTREQLRAQCRRLRSLYDAVPSHVVAVAPAAAIQEPVFKRLMRGPLSPIEVFVQRRPKLKRMLKSTPLLMPLANALRSKVPAASQVSVFKWLMKGLLSPIENFVRRRPKLRRMLKSTLVLIPLANAMRKKVQ